MKLIEQCNRCGRRYALDVKEDGRAWCGAAMKAFNANDADWRCNLFVDVNNLVGNDAAVERQILLLDAKIDALYDYVKALDKSQRALQDAIEGIIHALKRM